MKAKAFRLMATKITTKSGINFETISCITDFRIMLNRKNTEIPKMDCKKHAQNLQSNFVKILAKIFLLNASSEIFVSVGKHLIREQT